MSLSLCLVLSCNASWVKPHSPYAHSAASCTTSCRWGFIFPLGVWINCTYALAKALPSPFLSWVGIVALCFLILLFVIVVIGTVKGAVTQQLFVAPCLGPDLKVPQHSTRTLASVQQDNV